MEAVTRLVVCKGKKWNLSHDWLFHVKFMNGAKRGFIDPI